MKCFWAGDRGLSPQRCTTRVTRITRFAGMIAAIALICVSWAWQTGQPLDSQAQAQTQRADGNNIVATANADQSGDPLQLAFQPGTTDSAPAPGTDGGAGNNTNTSPTDENGGVATNGNANGDTTAIIAPSEERLPTPIELWHTSPWIISIIFGD